MITEMDTTFLNCKKVSAFPSEKQRIKHLSWRSRLSYLLKNYSSAKPSSSRRRSYRPTADEVEQWALSFEKLLSNHYGLAAFQVFLKSEFCEENIEFWLACEDFRKITSPAKLTTRAEKIYEEFIRSESPKEINLDYQTKDAVARSLQQPTALCFATAQKKIYILMENSSYPRFIQSELYKELCTVAMGRVTRMRA
ncbi:hypothetical protein MATL_G00244200 [Megalops atlanticus]|uniref:RGS domain-containing protein n=1 Tax=Megalops atlanticus TaxID=7932 RepID=A0A9D3PCT3_MEGAT|nr:hypothetical protein MATL_G00244200 [Megalops atlanticus]